METIVQFLMLLICLTASLKLSHLPKWCGALYGGLAAAVVGLSSGWILEQSQSIFSRYVSDHTLRESMAILVTLESMLFVLFAFARLVYTDKRGEGGHRRRSRWIAHLLSYYPPLLVFPVLMYAQSRLFVTFTGYDFGGLTVALALFTWLFFALLPLVMRWLLPDRESRLELLFLCSILLFVLGLISTVDEGMRYSAPDYDFPWMGLATAVCLLLLFGAIGFFLPRLKQFFRHKP